MLFRSRCQSQFAIAFMPITRPTGEGSAIVYFRSAKGLHSWSESRQTRMTAKVLLATMMLFAGCRVFHRQRISDESFTQARHLSLQGLDAQMRGDWERSESLFAAAILKCPSDERARGGYAEALWKRGAADQATISNLSAQYGAYDGEIIYNMAVNFAKVKNSLTDAQKAELDGLRTELLGNQTTQTPDPFPLRACLGRT